MSTITDIAISLRKFGIKLQKKFTVSGGNLQRSPEYKGESRDLLEEYYERLAEVDLNNNKMKKDEKYKV